jgi:hypothetical protein
MINIKLSDYDLKYNKYDILILEKNIKYLSQWTLVKYQDLTAYFCAKYILDESYSSCEEDKYICMGDILCFQTHLTRDDIINEYNKLNNKS